MNISIARGNFSQFDTGVEVVTVAGGTTVRESLSKTEILPFVTNLLDVVDDCLRKLGSHDDACDRVSDLFNELYAEMSK